MEDNHSLDRYLGYALCYGVPTCAAYFAWLFRCISGWSVFASRVVLVELIVTALVLGYTRTFRSINDGASARKAVMFALGIYTFITYRRDWGEVGEMIYRVVLVLSLVCAVLLLLQRVRSRRHTQGEILRRKLLKWMSMSATIFGTGMLVLNLWFLGNALLGGQVFSTTHLDTTGYRTKVTMEENKDVIQCLAPEIWETLTMDEKLSILQVVADIETDVLGNPNRITVSAEVMDGNTMAYYRDKTKSIVFNVDHLEHDTVAEVLNSCCHEAYHSYQHCLVALYNDAGKEYKNLMIFEEANRYREEFSNYIDGENNMAGYYFQLCEETARAYAETAVEKYYDVFRR